MTIAVVLAGASPLSRGALERALDVEHDLEVVATTDDLEEVATAFEEHDVAVTLVDTRADAVGGLRLARWIRTHVPGCAVVMLAAAATDRMIVEAYTTRSLALVTEGATCAELVETIRDAAAGLRLISAEDARAAHQRLRSLGPVPSDDISEADTRLAGLVSHGLTDAEIAARLHLSVQTVRNRVSRLLRSLGMTNRVQLAVFACRHLDPADMTHIPVPGPSLLRDR